MPFSIGVHMKFKKRIKPLPSAVFFALMEYLVAKNVLIEVSKKQLKRSFKRK